MTRDEWRAECREQALSREEDAALWAELHGSMQREKGLFRWLVAHPVEIRLLRRLPGGNRGIYLHGPTPAHARILLDASQPAGSVAETFWHETGHHLHRCEKARIDAIIMDAFGRVTVPGCAMAAKPDEMFAEALSARLTYFRGRFDAEYPIEAQCVIDALRVAGIAA